MAAATKIVFLLLCVAAVGTMVLGRPQETAVPEDNAKHADQQDLSTANSYGLGYGYGFGYPYGYYGLYGLGYGYGYPYYSYYGAYGYPFYG